MGRDEGPTRRAADLVPPLPDKLRLLVVAGPDKGRSIRLEGRIYAVGADASCDLVLTDPHVSRRHLELNVLPDAVEISDAGSTNGSYFGGVRFQMIRAGLGTSVSIGDTELRIISAGELPAGASPASAERFGRLLAANAAMRDLFEEARRAARSDVAILLYGETGTGKELLAEAIHAASHRASGPYVICDLASATPSLIESELYGHARGAFTGADKDRRGAFSSAHGGTIFLDEIGELEPEVQPRLLRALETRQIKPLGKTAFESVNVRVIAATNRDLAAEVDAGRFRRDLYFRLAVVCLRIPPLRERRDDIPLLVQHFLEQAVAGVGRPPPTVTPATLAALSAYDWPGNVRELKNVIERALALQPNAPTLDPRVLGVELPAGAAPPPLVNVDATASFKEAKYRLLDAWEREYVTQLLARAEGNVSLAARRAGIGRVSLYRLLDKHGLRPKDQGGAED